METVDAYQAWQINRSKDGVIRTKLSDFSLDKLPENDLLIRVEYSSLNNKDALSFSSRPEGIPEDDPWVPGIDLAGIVESSRFPLYRVGDPVFVTGWGLGVNTPGGLSEFASVPAQWVMPLPGGLDFEECMTFGTAGFTAGLCAKQLISAGVRPHQGPVLVTGSTGGVGSIAIHILAREGFEVVAATGKPNAKAWLESIGASSVISREEVLEAQGTALGEEVWSGVVDTVGGDYLACALKSCRSGGTVTACGMAGGSQLLINVFPFIQRGVNLMGIDSINCPQSLRNQVWHLLESSWKIHEMDLFRECIAISEVEAGVRRLLEGSLCGRLVVRIGAS